MAKVKYEEEANRLAKAIDIAIDAFTKFLPKDWDERMLKQFVTVYSGIKTNILNPLPQFKNASSLKYAIDDIFTYFQESAGQTVEYFWQQVNRETLGYKRENRLAKILKRGEIKNDIEYQFITDVIVPYQQNGIIHNEDVILLNQMLSAFEKKPTV